MIKKYYDADCNLGLLDNKTVAIMGFGSQGHAHAQNLKESGVKVIVGLRKDSANFKKAEEAGLKVMEVADAAKAADIVMMLVPDEVSALSTFFCFSLIFLNDIAVCCMIKEQISPIIKST